MTGIVDHGFGAIGKETIELCWPVFAAAAATGVWLLGKVMRRWRRIPRAWIGIASLALVAMAASLWMESFLAARLVYETAGEGAQMHPWQDLEGHYWRSRPLLVMLAVVLLPLAGHPRSVRLRAGLVATAGVLASWIVAMWLYVSSHQPIVFRFLVVPGGLAIVASLVGFTAATLLWMVIARWAWRARE